MGQFERYGTARTVRDSIVLYCFVLYTTARHGAALCGRHENSTARCDIVQYGIVRDVNGKALHRTVWPCSELYCTVR